MKTLQGLLCVSFLLLTLTVSSPLLAADWVVIVHPDNPTRSLSKSEAADLFLKRKTRWDHGVKVEPADHVGATAARASFYIDVTGKNVSAIEAYWQQQIFSGRGVPPARLDSDRAMVDFVSSRPGGVGFLATPPSDPAVRVVTVE